MSEDPITASYAPEDYNGFGNYWSNPGVGNYGFSEGYFFTTLWYSYYFPYDALWYRLQSVDQTTRY